MSAFGWSDSGVFGSMINKGLTALIEKKLAGAGTVEHVELDKQQRSIQVTLLLEGESEPLLVSLEGYRLEEQHGRTKIVFERTTASRRWMAVLLQEYGQEFSFLVPEKYASLVGFILP